MEKKNIEFILLDSLEKVFPDEMPRQRGIALSGLRAETVSFQAAYRFSTTERENVRVRANVQSLLPVRVRAVGLVPVETPCSYGGDENYLRKTPGLYPDLLEDIAGEYFILPKEQWRSLWIDVEIPRDCEAGEYEVTVSLTDDDGDLQASKTLTLTVIGRELMKLPIHRTEWFYADCLADYYKVSVYSEEHWRIIENFIRLMSRRKCNMLLTPVFTPPLDTYVGGERTNVQLVKINVTAGKYSFDFSLLERFVRLAQDCGFEYFEISHLFTQWGVKAAPNIYGFVDGEYKRLYGWDTPAVGGVYEEFLHIFLPELVKELKRLNIADRCYFHISDEPGVDILEDYKKAKSIVAPYLEGVHMMDALSEYSFYADGLVETPVCANSHMTEFLEHKVENLWSYYCCGQEKEVSNRFMAMPSCRNRIFGIQLYLYKIKGMLHWGYNFYNNVVSRGHIDPYRVTDCEHGMPSGDSFLVYPGKDGQPEESIRIMVLDEAMSDLCALYELEAAIGRDGVEKMIDEEAGMRMTFTHYPNEPEFILRLRKRVNEALAGL